MFGSRKNGFMKKALLAAAFLALAAGVWQVGDAQAAQVRRNIVYTDNVHSAGDIDGLTDLATSRDVRPYTYDVRTSGRTPTKQLYLVPLIESADQSLYQGFFETSADALNVIWSHNTAGMNVATINPANATAQEWGGAGSGKWYYSLAVPCAAGAAGPDSWHAMYAPNSADAYVDLTFVRTNFGAPDSGTVTSVNIDFRDASADVTGADIASLGLVTVSGADDTTAAGLGVNGRSYPTALDAVGHGTKTNPAVVTDYVFYNDSIQLQSITFPAGQYAPDYTNGYYWLYGVYNLASGNSYTLDAHSAIIAPDDYRLQPNQLVMWKYGSYDNYGGMFPSTLNWP
jgi:hypothetical protein